MKKFLCILSLLILSTSVSYAKVWEIRTDSDGFSNNPLSIRQAVSMASTGDTIWVNVAGQMNLASDLVISTDLIFLGPAPTHFQFTSSTGNWVIKLDAQIRFYDLGFSNKTGGLPLLSVNSAVADIIFERCAFRDLYSGGAGGAVDMQDGSVQFQACSFFNCQAAYGGAINSGGNANVKVDNSSFINCSANFSGGAIQTEGGSKTNIQHCTFYGNTATTEGGAIYALASGPGDTRIGSCLFDPSNTSSSSANVHSSGTTISLGYNLMDDNQGASGVFTNGTNNDRVGGAYVFGLRSSGPVTDGYGLVWIPIEEATSDAIGNGNFSGFMHDNRRAPRQMKDDVGVAFGNTDIGAVEYTPYRVTQYSGPYDLNNAINDYNSSGGNVSLEFDLPGGQNFSLAIPPLTYPGSSMEGFHIDGFTQDGSLVPGPPNNAGNIVTGVCLVSILTSGVDGFIFDGTAGSVSGITFKNLEKGVGITNNTFEKVHVFGNHFAIDEWGVGSGVYQVVTAVEINGGYYHEIGGPINYHRNTIGNFQQTGVRITNNSFGIKVENNFIGLEANGNSTTNFSGSNPEGIRCNSNSYQIDIFRNIIGGIYNGIKATGCYDFRVLKNKVGITHNNGSAPITESGIEFEFNATGGYFKVGNAQKGNIIGNCKNGIYFSNLTGSPTINVFGNLVGIDESSASHSNSNNGIISSFTDGITIGGVNPDDKNCISGTSGNGIRLDNSNGNTVQGNFIGTDVNGLGQATLSLGNGIILNSADNNAIGNELANPNIIANTSNNGIWVYESDFNLIVNNRIGEDKNYNDFGNNYGITFFNSSNNQVGASAPNKGNIIANSTNNAIGVQQGTQNIFTRDSIFDNGRAFELYDNTSNNDIHTNWIYDNTTEDFIGATGTNQFNIEKPTIIAATQCGSLIRVATDLTSTTGDIRFEYYTIPNGGQHPTGDGEGNLPELLTSPVTISGSPHSQVDVFSSTSHGIGDYVSCLISSYDGTNFNTSDFSNHMQISGPVTTSISSATDVSCNGMTDGVIYFNFSGGNGPYSCELLNSTNTQIATQNPATAGSYSFTSLSADTYYVIVTDATGCADTSNSFTVAEPSAIVSSPSVVDENCPGANDGSIDIESTVSGGTPGYQYSIDGGLSYGASGYWTGLAPGTYNTAIMDANGCFVNYFGLVVNPGNDVTNPTITCPGNQNVSFNASCAFALADYTGMATTSDNCGTVTVTQSPSAGTLITSTQTITLTADDGNGNTATCTFDVIPADNTNPSLTCPGIQNEYADAFCSFTLPDYTGMASASDNCGSPTLIQSPSPGTSIGLGTTTITITANDGNGNSASCTFNVTVTDTISPTISCPGNQTGTANGTCLFTLPDYTGMASASDNCGAPTITQAPVSGTNLSLGTHSITLTANDGNGNSSSCSFDVVVSDVTPPTITCPGNQTGNVDASCEFSIPDYTALVSTSDNCGVPTLTQSPSPGTIYTGAGTYTITMTATHNGLSSNCSFDVVVTDATPPSITCPGNQTEPLDNSCQFILPNYSSLASVMDNCGIDTVLQSPAPGTIITGTTTLTLTVLDDNGLSNTCTFDVITQDQTTPVAICQNITVVLDNTGNATILASDLDNGSSDNCTPQANLIFSASQTSFSCTDLSAGATTGSVSIDFTVEDAAGNIDQCTATVIVDGSNLPGFNAGTDMSLCEGTPANLAATYSGPNTNFTWTTFDGSGTFSNPSSLSTDYIPSNGEVGLVHAIISSTDICPATADTIVITYVAAPSFTYTTVDENCNLSDGSITVTPSPSGTFQYSYDGGTTWGTNATETALSAGSYVVSVQDMTTMCTSPSQTVTINLIPGVQWDETSWTDIFCNGSNDGSFEGTTVNNLYNHNYILNPMGISQPNDSLFTNLSAGNYQAIVIAANGCSDTVAFTINEPAPIILNLSVSDFCLPQVGEIVAAGSGGLAPYKYSDDGVNFTSTDTFTSLIPGNYTIYVQDDNGCTNSAVATVGGTILLPPNMAVSNVYCEGNPYTASGSSTVGADSLIWFNNVNPLDSLMGSNVTLWNYLNNQDSVFLTYMENGCLAFPAGAEFNYENNTVDAGPDIVICPGDSGQLFAEHGIGNFLWTNPEITNPSDPNAYISLNADGYVIATEQTANCYFTDSAFVDVDESNPECGLGVVNAFSPNGDGINDTWYIQAVEDHPSNSVTIFNRWGDEIIHIDNYDNLSNYWDGKLSNGNMATEGTYFYVIELKDVEQKLNGWIQITN